MLHLSLPDLLRLPRQAFQLTLPGQRVLLLTLLTLQRSPATLPLSPSQAFQRRPPSQLTSLLVLPLLQPSLPDLLRCPRQAFQVQRALLLTLLTLQRSLATLPLSLPQAFQRRL